MDIAGGLGLTGLVFTFATIPMVIGKVEADNWGTSRMYGKFAAAFGILALVGYIAAIWTAVLS